MSDDPRRLRDDPAIAAALRHDLSRAAGARWAHYDEEKGLSRLQAAVALSPGPDGGQDGSPGESGSSAEGGSPAEGAGSGQNGSLLQSAGPGQGGAVAGGKLLGASGIGAAVLAGAGLGGVVVLWLALQGGPDAAAPGSAAPAVATAAESPAAPASASAAPADTVSAPAAAAPAASPPQPAGRAPPAQPATPATAAGSTSAAAAAKSALAEEVAQLGRIRAVAGGDPAAALALVDEGHVRFAGGTLGPEREVIAIDALSRLGRRAEARARGEKLLARLPDGPFAERIRALIGP
jgi:hypothetical protein